MFAFYLRTFPFCGAEMVPNTTKGRLKKYNQIHSAYLSKLVNPAGELRSVATLRQPRIMALRLVRSAIIRGSLGIVSHQNGSVVCVQDNQLPVQTYVDVLCCHGFQIRGQLELITDTF